MSQLESELNILWHPIEQTKEIIKKYNEPMKEIKERYNKLIKEVNETGTCELDYTKFKKYEYSFEDEYHFENDDTYVSMEIN